MTTDVREERELDGHFLSKAEAKTSVQSERKKGEAVTCASLSLFPVVCI